MRGTWQEEEEWRGTEREEKRDRERERDCTGITMTIKSRVQISGECTCALCLACYGNPVDFPPSAGGVGRNGSWLCRMCEEYYRVIICIIKFDEQYTRRICVKH